MALAPGTRLGPYEIVAALGEGGMGEVYRARDTRLDRDVAVKILPTGQADSVEARERFDREAKAVAALNHPHILTLFDVGAERGVTYAVTELVEGRTLRDVLTESGAVPTRKAVEYGLQIAQGLAAAHAKGITHRDLKPENLILTPDGQIKILDFGLAKIGDAGADRASGASQLTALVTRGAGTAQGTILGTVGYMAPEQVRGQATDARTDLFALGAILFELVTGARAFSADSAVETMTAILKSDPLEPSPAANPLPPAIERIVRHALEKQPDERYQTARDFAYDLRALVQSSTLSVSPSSSSLPTVSERPVSSPVRGLATWIVSLGAAAILAIGAALGFAVARSTSQAPPSHDVMRFLLNAPEQTTFSLGSGAAPWPSLSPDGQRLVFAATTASNKAMLWMRVMGSVAAQPIAGTENAIQPFWSPDGRHLAFFADRKLKKLDLGGGAPETICDTGGVPRKGTWSKEGVILFALQDEGLFRASSTTTGRAPVPLPPASGFTDLRYPTFLPDGRRFLALAVVSHPADAIDRSKSVVVAGSIDRPGELSVVLREASEAQYASGYLIYVREGNLVARSFDSDRLTLTGEPVTLAEGVSFTPQTGIGAFSTAGSMLVHAPTLSGFGGQLTWYDRQGHPGDSLGAANDVRGFDIHAQGVLAHAHDLVTGGDIWRYTLSGDAPTRLTYPPTHNVAPIWSPDGASFAFSRGEKRDDDRRSVYIRRVDAAAGEERVFGPSVLPDPTSWSPDGKYLIVEVNSGPPTGYDVWLVALTGDRAAKPLLATPDAEAGARLSPDGKWLAYMALRRGESSNVYLQAFPEAAGSIQITTEGGEFPVWSHSGHELFFITRDGDLASVTIDAAGGSVRPSTPRVLFRLPAGATGATAPFGVSPDDQRFLIPTNSSRNARPMIVTAEWPSLVSSTR